MATRKSYDGPTYPERWLVEESYQLSPRRRLDPTIEFKVAGKRNAWYRFTRWVLNPDNGAQWIDCVGGVDGDEKSHSFSPGKITQTRKRAWVSPGKPKATRPQSPRR